MIHRDVKSQNILLSGFQTDSLDDESHAKVADFGTAREDDHDTVFLTSGKKTHASTKAVVGTTPYMPTEYIQSGHVSEKTDAFAFGIIVVELLTNLSCVQARTLADEHEGTTLPKALMELSMQAGWPHQPAKILSNVATTCTRGTKSRTTPAVILVQVESAYKMSSTGDGGSIFGIAFS
jgi:serine/threonine protein kinase